MHLADNEEHLARLRGEARSASSLNHPNIVTIYEIGRDDSRRTFMAMEFVGGQTLRELARTELPVRKALQLAARAPFTEMESFVKDLEARPVERLLRDLPELADLPDTKVSLVSYVISSEYRGSEPAEKLRMRESVAATFEQLGPGEVRDRVGQILDRLR